VAPRIWIGNSVRVATHHDMNSNIAVVMAGRRRFTLFPPDHVPEERRGIRGRLSEESKARVRRQLGQMMSR